MNKQQKYPPPIQLTVENLLQAISVVNRHAKTAPNPKFLYKLKHDSLHKLLAEGKAKKLVYTSQIIQDIVNNNQIY